jgi:hypothetical protein
MLPGFRFLAAAILLSTSLLVFGVGAAALLRAAHKDFASAPLLRGPHETVFAEQDDAVPALATARVESPAPDEDVPAQISPDQSPALAEVAEAGQSSGPSDRAAAPGEADAPADDPPSATLKEVAAENAATTESAPEAELSSPPEEPKIAVVEVAASDQAPPAQAAAAPLLHESTRMAQTRIAALGVPSVPVQKPARSSIGKPSVKSTRRAVVKKPVQVKPVTVRPRRIVQRPQAVRAAAQQRFANPFGFPFGN